MNGMMRWNTKHKSLTHISQLIKCHCRQHTENWQNGCCDCKNSSCHFIAVIRLCFILLLNFRITVLLYKKNNKQLCHVSNRHGTRNNKEPFDHFKQCRCACTGCKGKCSCAMSFLQKLDILHNALMDQCLADITIEKRNTANTKRTHQECIEQQWFLTSKSPDIVKIQFVQIHNNHAGCHKQHKL